KLVNSKIKKTKALDIPMIGGEWNSSQIKGYSEIHYLKRHAQGSGTITIKNLGNIVHANKVNLIHIDDAFISGRFTDTIITATNRLNYVNLFLNYYVCPGKEHLATNPYFEKDLNSYSITTILDLSQFINEGDVMPTRRFARMLLQTDHSTMINFCRNLNDTGVDFINDVLRLLCASNFEDYDKRSIEIKCSEIRKLL
ncbi:hypothetical protein KDA11_06955, partial [Candidatus Saccharibacteria bacterium]|nr:hypothetical protein [Candidatus Saccharibacteria bacterium]